MTARAWALATLFGLVIGTAGMACSRTQIEFDPILEGSPGGSAGGTGFGGSSGFAGGSGGIAGGGGVAGSGGSSGGGGVSACEAHATSGCQTCTCESCPAEWQSCDDDGGCLEILDCADQAGCTGVQCYLGPCNAVIDQHGGPLGESAGLAQDVGQCREQVGCPCGGGSGGTAGTGGVGGATGGTGGSGGSGPIACLTCITQKCPAITQCLLDQACRDGVICAFQDCLGSGGIPNFTCLLGCFGGDLSAAMQAFQALQCFFTQCSTACQGAIPGLPGFGGSGGSP
jgi:hypothetical protein